MGKKSRIWAALCWGALAGMGATFGNDGVSERDCLDECDRIVAETSDGDEVIMILSGSLATGREYRLTKRCARKVLIVDAGDCPVVGGSPNLREFSASLGAWVYDGVSENAPEQATPETPSKELDDDITPFVDDAKPSVDVEVGVEELANRLDELGGKVDDNGVLTFDGASENAPEQATHETPSKELDDEVTPFVDDAKPSVDAEVGVEELRERLEAQGFKKEDVVVWTFDGASENASTQEAIETRVKEFVDGLKPDDYAVVYLRSRAAANDAKSEDDETALSVDKLFDAMKKSDAKTGLLLVDDLPGGTSAQTEAQESQTSAVPLDLLIAEIDAMAFRADMAINGYDRGGIALRRGRNLALRRRCFLILDCDFQGDARTARELPDYIVESFLGKGEDRSLGDEANDEASANERGAE